MNRHLNFTVIFVSFFSVVLLASQPLVKSNSKDMTDHTEHLIVRKNKKSHVSSHNYFVFAYFKNKSVDGLHLAGSKDGLHWKAFNNDSSLLKPAVAKDRLMRDPCIIKGADGLFHMVWTVSWADKGIGYASSADLIHWSEQKFLPVMEKTEGTRNTWAPEITLNKATGEYMIYWASSVEGKFDETKPLTEKGYNHRIYYCTTSDFETFS